MYMQDSSKNRPPSIGEVFEASFAKTDAKAAAKPEKMAK
jgi:hypothetical protein